jgi:hypothetical protein
MKLKEDHTKTNAEQCKTEEFKTKDSACHSTKMSPAKPSNKPSTKDDFRKKYEETDDNEEEECCGEV